MAGDCWTRIRARPSARRANTWTRRRPRSSATFRRRPSRPRRRERSSGAAGAASGRAGAVAATGRRLGAAGMWTPRRLPCTATPRPRQRRRTAQLDARRGDTDGTHRYHATHGLCLSPPTTHFCGLRLCCAYASVEGRDGAPSTGVQDVDFYMRHVHMKICRSCRRALKPDSGLARLPQEALANDLDGALACAGVEDALDARRGSPVEAPALIGLRARAPPRRDILRRGPGAQGPGTGPGARGGAAAQADGRRGAALVPLPLQALHLPAAPTPVRNEERRRHVREIRRRLHAVRGGVRITLGARRGHHRAGTGLCAGT